MDEKKHKAPGRFERSGITLIELLDMFPDDETPSNGSPRTGGPAGKAIVAGVKDRETGQIAARVVPDTKSSVLTSLVAGQAEPGSQVFADEARGYLPLSRIVFDHQAVSHSTGRWVDEMAHTNGMESFWAMLERGYHGTYRQMSPEHLGRNVDKFRGRHNQRPIDTEEQMIAIAKGMDRKRTSCEQLIADGPHVRKRMKEMAA